MRRQPPRLSLAPDLSHIAAASLSGAGLAGAAASRRVAGGRSCRWWRVHGAPAVSGRGRGRRADWGAPFRAHLDGLGGAVSFTKGCYVGQELTSRTHFRGVVRKRALPVSFAAGTADVAPGAPLLPAGGAALGGGQHGSGGGGGKEGGLSREIPLQPLPPGRPAN